MSGSLAHSPADVVRHLLIDLAVGTIPSDDGSWPIFASAVPDAPDSAITVTDTTGMLEGRSQIDGEVQEHHGIQVAIRAPNHPDGYEKANAVAGVLDRTVRLNVVTIGSDQYTIYTITRKGGVIAAGTGPTDQRHLFTINAVVALRQTT